MSLEQEFRAVKRLTKILETLDPSARQRVLAFVAAERPQAKQATPGPQTITAANGDKVMFDYFGLLFAETGEGIGAFVFTGGTGRYGRATGGGVFEAQIDVSKPVNQPMTVVLDGKISY